MRKMTVVATLHKVPVEGSPRRYIDTEAPVVVDETTYYLRRISDGELKEIPAPAAPASSPTRKTEVK